MSTLWSQWVRMAMDWRMPCIISILPSLNTLAGQDRVMAWVHTHTNTQVGMETRHHPINTTTLFTETTNSSIQCT